MSSVSPDAGGRSLPDADRRTLWASAALLLAGALITPVVETPGVTPFLITSVDLPVRLLCAVGLALAARHHWRSGSASLYAFLALSSVLDLVAAMAFRAAVLLPGSVTQQMGDAMQLGAYVSVIMAILAVPRTNRWRSAQLATLDAVVAVGGFGLVVWYTLIRPSPVYAANNPTLAALTEVAYPVLDAAMLTVLIARARGGLTILPAPVQRMLTWSIVASFVGDGFIGISFYVTRVPWFVFASAICHAASTMALLALGMWGRRIGEQGANRSDPRAEATLPPLAAAASVLVLAVMGQALWQGGAVDRVLFGGGIGLAAAIAMRQVFAARRQVAWLSEREVQLEREVADRTIELARANDALQALATSDGLTGLANRRHFDESFQEQWRQSLRSGQPLAVLLLDVDAFKAYNDNFGHGAGDTVLIEVGRLLQSVARRQTDLVARYGGEEFVILCPGTTPEGASQFAATVLDAIRAARLPHAASPVEPFVTVSIGVVSMVATAGVEATALIQVADEALYEAKRGGRNRAIVRDMDTRPEGNHD